jgi:tetratricopeptide (TPR) repeat protein
MRLTCLSGLLAFIVLNAALSAQTTRLKLGRAVRDDVSEGKTRAYSIKLKAHQYFRADVTQPNPAVLIELDAPDAKKVLEVDTRNLSKPSRIVWVAEIGGDYRLRVSGAGHYEIKLQELRKAGPDDPKRVEAERLFAQGLSEARRYAYNQAISTYTRALSLYRDVKDREREGNALNALGNGYFSLNQYEKAIGQYEQALEIRREVKDRQAEAGNLENLGNAYYHLSQFDKAIEYYEQALPIRREVKDRQGEGQTLNGLGNAYNLMSQNDRAVVYYERSLAIAREVKNRTGQANALNSLGNACVDLSQYEKAIRYFEDTSDQARDKGPPRRRRHAGQPVHRI